jgi:preprotein translocase subunit SecA
MFSSSLANAAEAMRPGLISGRYPERDERAQGWIDHAFSALRGHLARLRIDRHSGLRKVSAAVGRQGEALVGLDTAQLEKLRIELRRRFRSQGLSYPLCIRAFALIRELAGRTIHLRHYDSQLMSGWVILHGQLAEMETGEGKTLAATLAAATAALSDIPVHVITVNEYLVKRDAQAMRPLYEALGLTVGYVTESLPPEVRRAAYACDITYCTNKQVAFDYLHDRLLLGNNRSRLRLQLESAYGDNSRLEKFLLRGLCFAIVDEADSVLIDEARTPLILTRNVDNTAEHTAYRQALKLAQELINEGDFYLDAARGGVQLSLTGQQKLAAHPLSREGLWRNARRREELVCLALQALHLLHKDHDYLVFEDKVLIIDANTGRTMPDRSWERGLHQLVEAKEGCPLTDVREQLGRITYQRFFRRYLRLGGMTGTAREVSAELWSDYGLRVRRIPLHRPGRRRELPTLIYPRAEEKWAAVVASVKDLQGQGRPVLVGTVSVGDSELLSRKLTVAGIAHRVLNARQDRAEAEIVAAAGKLRQVTVATNMAGRGTDIPLAAGVVELGGLHVIAACRNNAKRIDRQLSGRCGRQGDPGSHQAIISLEDNLIRQNGRLTLIINLSSRWKARSRFQRKLALYLIRRAQGQVERRHREARRALRQFDRQTGRLLAFSGQIE